MPSPPERLRQKNADAMLHLRSPTLTAPLQVGARAEQNTCHGHNRVPCLLTAAATSCRYCSGARIDFITSQPTHPPNKDPVIPSSLT